MSISFNKLGVVSSWGSSHTYVIVLGVKRWHTPFTKGN